MKQWVGKGLSFCFLLSLMSCAATMNMFIEVEKPAAVTLPVTAQNVIIVNNALPQPIGYGLSAPSGRNRGNDSVYAETLYVATWRVISTAVKYLDNSNFFSKVSLYRKFLRKDNEWLAFSPVDEEIKNDFFENENFDLIISVDRLLFSSTVQSDKVELGKINMSLTFSAYLRGEDEPLVHSTITDSLKAYYDDIYFYENVPHIDSETLITEMIRNSSFVLGEKLGKFFVPTWDTVERIYFVKNFSETKQMAFFINKGKWSEAKITWTDKFDLAKNVADKAKFASNIALACEMNDEFSGAGVWAKEAKTYFQTASAKKYSKEITYLDTYIKVLHEREQNNIKLNQQYGIKER